MKILLTKYLIIFPLAFSFFFNKIDCESKEVESPHSTSFLLLLQNDSLNLSINIVKKLYKKKEYSKALKKAFFITQNTVDVEKKIELYELIGDIFSKTNNHKRAIENYVKIIDLLDKQKYDFETITLDTKKIAKLYFNLGGEYQLISNIDSSLFYFNKVLKINSLNDEVNFIKANTYNNLSILYRENNYLKNLDLAKIYINKAIKIHEKKGEIVKIAASYGNLANIYMEEGKFIKAEKLYQKGLNLIENLNTTEAVKYKEVLNYNLAWTLFNQKNYMSYYYLEKSIIISDSLKTIDIFRATEELQLEHNVVLATKNAEAKRLLAEKNALQAKENTWLVGGIGVISVLLLLSLLSYYKLRQRNLSLKLSENELVQQKNIEKIKIEAQTKILNATLDGKEKERKQIAEILHDNVSAMLSSANLHLKASQKQFEELPIELKKTQAIIKEASQQIRNLSHNLVSSVLLKFGLTHALKDIAEKYSNSVLKIEVDTENLSSYKQEFEIKIYYVIQELINNIIKHSKASITQIKLYEKGELFFLVVKDNGIGFDKNKVAIKNTVGLNQIDARVKMYKGEFIVNSHIGEGTQITISLPLSEIEKKVTVV